MKSIGFLRIEFFLLSLTVEKSKKFHGTGCVDLITDFSDPRT